jgi:predicted Zn-dependent peptidase
MEFKQTQLDNGLKIVIEVNSAAASMAAGFFVRTGSRDETPEISGTSHFLEHMMFKGSARRSAADVNREFDEMGAHYNAFTSEENTVYYAAVLPEFQDRLLDLLGDMLRPALRGQDFDVEKNVILEEIAVYDDQPRFRIYENLMGHHFRGHPLGNSILGTRQSISALLRDQMQAYFDRRYSPDNMTFVAVGNLDYDRLISRLGTMCSHWKASGAVRATLPAAGRSDSKIIVDPKVAREHVGMMSPGPFAQDEAVYAGQLLATVIGDSTGSRLFYALVEPAIVDEASMSFDPLDGAGAFLTFLSADAERAPEAVRIAKQEYRKFQEEGATEDELLAAKNKIASAATLKGEIPMGRLTSVGFDWVYRKEYVPLATQIEKMFAVTRQDILALAQKYDLTATSMVALGPLEEI